MKVKILLRVNVKEEGKKVCRVAEPGEVVDLPFHHATELLGMGRAELVPDTEPEKKPEKKPETKSTDAEPKKEKGK